METLLIIIISLLGIASLVITFYAIIQILSNDFKDSKPVWIAISMIAFVGPILWFTHTRKLISPREPSVATPTQEHKQAEPAIPAEPFLQSLISGLTLRLKYSLASGISLILMGYLLRICHINFFWESTTIGYIILMVTLMFALQNQINANNEKGRKSSDFKVAFWMLFGVMAMQTLFTVVLFFTNAYDETKINLQQNKELQTELGDIHSFTLLPNGSFQFQQYGDKRSGTATMHIIVKGEHKFAMVYVSVEKSLESDWEIRRIIRM